MKKYIIISIIFHLLIFYSINSWFIPTKPTIDIKNISVGIVKIIEPKTPNIKIAKKENFIQNNSKLENLELKKSISKPIKKKEIKVEKQILNNNKTDDNNKNQNDTKNNKINTVITKQNSSLNKNTDSEPQNNKQLKNTSLKIQDSITQDLKNRDLRNQDSKNQDLENRNLKNENLEKTDLKNNNISNNKMQTDNTSNKNIINKTKIETEKIIKNDTINQNSTQNYQNNIDSNNLSSNNKPQIETIEYNKNIDFKIIKYTNPKYPTPAKNLKLKKDVIVTANFIVNEFGDVENIELTSNYKDFKKLGFYNEVEKVIKNYKFSPIYYNNKIVKVKFRKNYKFISPYTK
jgi:predicted RNase H-like nuclease (RuvC/YqgF family)